MSLDDRPQGTESLSVSECWTLLRESPVARLAVNTSTGPDIFPINIVVDGGSLVFRTSAGTKLHATASDARVAVETDGWTEQTAWSVVIRGKANEVTDLYGVINSFDLPLYPWEDAAKGRFVRITPESITGRRFPITSKATWADQHPDSPHGSPE